VVPTIEDVGTGDGDTGDDDRFKEYDQNTDWSLEMAKAAKAGDWEAVEVYGGYRDRKIQETGIEPAMSTDEIKQLLERAYK